MGNKNIMCDRFVYVSDSINIKKESRSAVYNIIEREVKPDVEEQPGRWNAMVSRWRNALNNIFLFDDVSQIDEENRSYCAIQDFIDELYDKLFNDILCDFDGEFGSDGDDDDFDFDCGD